VRDHFLRNDDVERVLGRVELEEIGCDERRSWVSTTGGRNGRFGQVDANGCADLREFCREPARAAPVVENPWILELERS